MRWEDVGIVCGSGVDRVREELQQQLHHLRRGAEDAIVRAVVDRELVDLGHLHQLRLGHVLEPTAVSAI